MLSAGASLRAQLPAAPPTISWSRIPSGTFHMGCVPADARCEADERPRHLVTLSRAFELMTTEVSVAIYRATSPSTREQPPWSTTPDHPVTLVTWDDARRFCEAIGGRLPTEAEWEYAARGGRDDAVYPWGDQDPSDRAGAAAGVSFESDAARPVRTFAPNGYGLYDMSGNAWEWTADWYGRYEEGAATDPHGPSTGRARVVRGGSYGDDSANLRVSNRSANLPRNNNLNIGFRCARDLPR
jgi:formylglycine-generating enzyme required for sulfatase activity